MADLLGTALSVGNGLSTGSQSASDLLIESFRRTKQPSIDSLQNKQSSLENRQIFFNKLRSQLDNLTAKADTFLLEGASDSFNTKKITVSDNSVLTATSESNSLLGISTVKVDRLATNDILISSRKKLTDSYVFAGTTKTISINSLITSITFDIAETNETAFTKIAASVNGNSNSNVTVAVIKDTSSTARITFTSKFTGATKQIKFNDGEVLEEVGISELLVSPNNDNRTTSSSISAGFKLAKVEDLDSQIQINGVQVTRDKNSLNDVLPGITINLQKTQSAEDVPISLTTSVDTDKLANSVIQPFLDSFNSTIRFLKQDQSNYRNDSSIRLVYSKLRSIIAEPINSVSDGSPKYLTDIGIKIGTDGILGISDRITLQGFLESNPKILSDLFTTSDGFAAKAKNAISTLLGSDGLISSRNELLRGQISLVSSRKLVVQKRIDSQSNSLRKEYENLQKVYLKAQSQFSLLNGFPSSSFR